jgi:sugar phosphate isomerase/epimerase
MSQIKKEVHVNIPFTMLYESYLSRFLEYGINPEISFDAIALERFSLFHCEPVAKKLHERGLSVTMHAPFTDLSPGSPDPAVRELTRHRFQQLMQLVPAFRPKTIVCHTGWDPKRYWDSLEAWTQDSLDFWSWFLENMSKEEAVVILENVYEQEPSEFLNLYKYLKDKGAGFCLDTGHQAVFSGAGLLKWVEALGDHIVQLHLHDNHGIQDDHLALGEGTVDFKMLFASLKERRRRPPIITLEPHREEDLWPSMAYLEGIWPW